MTVAALAAIAVHFPERVLGNDELAALFPQWSAAKILEKTGIETRHIAAENECASDLGVAAVEKLFASGRCVRGEVDYLLLCTSSPDYALPTTACLMQSRLGLRNSCGAIDINQGCSGFVYGLGLAKGLIESGQAKQVLLVTAETYSHYLHPEDHTTRTLFGDGAAATLIVAVAGNTPMIGPFSYGSDGHGAPHLIVRNSAARHETLTPQRLGGADGKLWMDGPEIFNFTLGTVPAAVSRLLQMAGLTHEQVDGYVLHQANHFMLEALRRKMQLPVERFHVGYRHCGNTVSSSIPIALHTAQASGAIRDGQTLCLVGFGVGYSWAATLLRPHWPES